MTLVRTKYRMANPRMDFLHNIKREVVSNSSLMGMDCHTCNYPRIDFSELDANYILRAELPGFGKKDLDIKYEKGVLTIKGKREDQLEGSKVLHRERFLGEFVRHFSLPDHIKHNELEAEYQNGILIITLPKEETAKLKEIKISE